MKKFTHLSILVLFAAVFSAVNVFAAVDQEKKNVILNTADPAVLIETIQQPGVSDNDIFMKGIACRRLAVIGDESALPVLAKMLREDVRLSYFARYALEMMPFDGVDPILMDAVKTLDAKEQRVGCILSLGVRGCSAAVPMLKEIVNTPKTVCDKKAAYAALGMISGAEAADFLMECAKTTSEEETYAVRKALADAMLDAAEVFERSGDLAKAAQVYDAVVVPCFPVYAQKAGAYHGLLVRKTEAAAALVTKLHSPKDCCFTGGLKTIREYADADGETITKACIAELPKLTPCRRALVLRALGDRADEASRKLIFPVLKEAVNAKETNVRIAAIQALKKVGTLCPMEAAEAMARSVMTIKAEDRQTVLDAMVETASAWKCKKLDAALAENVSKLNLKDTVLSSAYFQVIENRRISAAGPELAKIAKTEGLDAQVRDRVLAALSEIVTLESLDLLVKALDGEKDDKKVAWILRAACTRLPREDCALAVTKMFDTAANAEEKGKILTLLKQIGGKAALACVEKACWDEATADIATQTLGTWNTPDDMMDVAAACLKLAKECPVEKFQIRAIRSFIRIPRQFDLPVKKKFEMCRTAFETAKRSEDKALIFEVFKRIITVESAQQAFSYAQYPQFQEAACEAVVAIAKKFQGTSNSFGAILDEVSKIAKDPQVVQDAKAAKERLGGALANAPIEILSAKYGADKRFRDVTTIIQDQFSGENRIPLTSKADRFRLYNKVFGDPAPATVKQLIIEVRIKATGETHTLKFEEDEVIVLPFE